MITDGRIFNPSKTHDKELLRIPRPERRGGRSAQDRAAVAASLAAFAE